MVLSCASDLNVTTYYQYTDSIHLNYDDVERVVERYKQKYDQELVGDGSGNFRVYVSMDGAVTEIYGIEVYS